MSKVSPKHQLLEQFAIVAKALGHAHRLDLLEFLAQGERGVEALAKATGMTTANASQHLQHLRRAGLVTSRKDGLFVLYSLAGDDVLDLIASLRTTAERHVAEVDRVVDGYFRERDSLEPVSRDELMQRTKDGLVTVIDVRPSEEYDAGHIRGATNVPLSDLKKRLSAIPKGQEVIAYCRGPYCVLAFEAVYELRRKGYNVRRLADGFPEWKAAGLPVE
ncbi:MAG: metalloregulator ArsR/SmtB family transcription factor [Rhodospirillales bacterium]|nr:metalloregulator ArsR/SmtB family transcription factor [Rhodospirillales bacterium]